jgi:hypothetical protein
VANLGRSPSTPPLCCFSTPYGSESRVLVEELRGKLRVFHAQFVHGMLTAHSTQDGPKWVDYPTWWVVSPGRHPHPPQPGTRQIAPFRPPDTPTKPHSPTRYRPSWCTQGGRSALTSWEEAHAHLHPGGHTGGTLPCQAPRRPGPYTPGIPPGKEWTSPPVGQQPARNLGSRRRPDLTCPHQDTQEVQSRGQE